MATKEAPTIPRGKPSSQFPVSGNLPDLENQVLIQIRIDEGDHSIHLYPHQETPVLVFHKRSGANPDYPELVRWVVTGLGGRMLRIEAKHPEKAHLLPGSPFTIKPGDNTILTVPAAGPGTWKYSIKLFDMHHRGDPVSTLDPTIEVVEEP